MEAFSAPLAVERSLGAEAEITDGGGVERLAGAQRAHVSVLERNHGQASAELDEAADADAGAEVPDEAVRQNASTGKDRAAVRIAQHERVVRVIEGQPDVDVVALQHVRRVL